MIARLCVTIAENHMHRLSYIVMDRLAALREDDLRPILSTLADSGYQGVEFNLTHPTAIPPLSLLHLTQEYHLTVPSFLTGEAYFDGYCLSSPRAEVRRQTVDRLISYLDIAQLFQSILVVGLLQGTRRDEADPLAANTRIADALFTVAMEAEKRNIDVVIEPVNHLQVGFHNSVAEVRDLIHRIGSPRIRPMVDTIHMNIEEASLTQPILDCGTTLRHVHLCESNGAQFGTGHIDFKSVLQALSTIGYDHWASVKVYRQLDLPTAARTSIQHLQSL